MIWETGYGLRVTGCELRVAGYGLRDTGCELRVGGCELGVAGKKGIEQRAKGIGDIEEFGSRNAECGKKEFGSRKKAKPMGPGNKLEK